MADPIELRQKRATLIEEARGILARAEKAEEKRDITSEEEEQFDRMMADADKLKTEYEREENLRSLENGLKQSIDTPHRLETAGQSKTERETPCNTDEYRGAYDSYVRHGTPGLNGDEHRALQVGSNTEGGFTVPDAFANQLIMAKEVANVMRQFATTFATTSGTLDIPTVSHGTAAWTAEEAAFTESDETFAQKTLSAHKAGRLIKVSEELLNDAAFDLDAYMAKEFGRSIGVLEEAAFVNGDGSAKPTGVVVDSTLGVSAAGAEAITSAEIIDLYHAAGRQYRSNATWLMADATVKLIRKLTEAVNGQFLWQPGLQDGQPDTLLGRPVAVSDGMPAPTTGLKSVIFGDLSYYWIGDRIGFSVQRLVELYAVNGQVGFLCRQRTDGVLTLATAVYHLIQA